MEFAVVDVETTGLNKFGNDKIIELAVIIMDDRGNITQGFSTLVNPKRDLGPTHIHQVTGEMVRDAPQFLEIAETLATLLNNRVVVAHNARFDCKMLSQELENAGFIVDLNSSMDTLEMSRKTFDFSNYKLSTICSELGVPLEGHHSALADATATAILFSYLLRMNPYHAIANSSFVQPTSANPSIENWLPREKALPKPQTMKEFLETLPVTSVQEDTNIQEAVVNKYLELLHIALLDKNVSLDAFNNIKSYINGVGLSKGQVINLNEEYLLLHLCAAIQLVQNIITIEDITHLDYLTNFLEIDVSDSQQLISAIYNNRHVITPSVQKLNGLFTIQLADRIVFSGEHLQYSKQEWETYLTAKGYAVGDSITKLTKVLVLSDLTSLSAKAEKARSRNIPLLTEESLIKMLGRPHS